jgi:hypothetical protein
VRAIDTTVWVLLGGAIWLVAAVGTALTLGAVIRLRDRREAPSMPPVEPGVLLVPAQGGAPSEDPADGPSEIVR